jgi:hypothetical protein
MTPTAFTCTHPNWLNTSRSGRPVLNISKCALCRKTAEESDIRKFEKREGQ